MTRLIFWFGVVFTMGALIDYFSLDLCRHNRGWIALRYDGADNLEPTSGYVLYTRIVGAALMVLSVALIIMVLGFGTPPQTATWADMPVKTTSYSTAQTDSTVLNTPFVDPTIYSVVGDGKLDPRVTVPGARRGDLVVGFYIPVGCTPTSLTVNETATTVRVGLAVTEDTNATSWDPEYSTCAFSAAGSSHMMRLPAFGLVPTIMVTAVHLNQPLGNRTIMTFDADAALFDANPGDFHWGGRSVRDPGGVAVPPVPLTIEQVP